LPKPSQPQEVILPDHTKSRQLAGLQTRRRCSSVKNPTGIRDFPLVLSAWPAEEVQKLPLYAPHAALQAEQREIVQPPSPALCSDRDYVWTCPGLMDTPKSAKVSAEGVNGGEGRKA
jgi:hypothetical protein